MSLRARFRMIRERIAKASSRQARRRGPCGFGNPAGTPDDEAWRFEAERGAAGILKRALRSFALAATIVFVAAAPSSAGVVVTETVEYKHGDTTCEGFLAYTPGGAEKRPGVLVVHEWKGLDEHAKEKAQALAALGYVAFAVDMYGKGVRAKDHKEAGELSGVYRNDRKLMRARAMAGLDVLAAHKLVDPKKIAAIGYCFGGTTVLELARSGANLAAVVSFHGALDTPTPAAPGAIKAKVLACHGADDKWTAGGIPAFQEEMSKAGADWQLHSYGGAVHSFTVKHAGADKSAGMAYDEAADRRSWAAMLGLFKEVFGS